MALSEVGIVNSALVSIGEDTITSLDQACKAARAAKRVYAVQRDRMLMRYRWTFAMKRAEIAADPDPPPFGYQARYRLPEDCLQFVGIFDEAENNRQYTSRQESHKVEGGFVLVDYSGSLPIFYVRRVTNPVEFDPTFTEALSLQLAIKLAYALTSGVSRIGDLKEEFSECLRQARVNNAFQSTPEITDASTWLDSRYYGVAGPYRMGPVN